MFTGMLRFLRKRGIDVYLVSFSLFVEYWEYFWEPILIFRIIYKNPTVHYNKVNFSPKQLPEMLVDN